MKFTIKRNWIDVIGLIWMPSDLTCAMRYDLKAHNLEDIGEPTRDNVSKWLALHSGDFQSITDFHAIVGKVEIPWEIEESAFTFHDCIYGNEE